MSLVTDARLCCMALLKRILASIPGQQHIPFGILELTCCRWVACPATRRLQCTTTGVLKDFQMLRGQNEPVRGLIKRQDTALRMHAQVCHLNVLT